MHQGNLPLNPACCCSRSLKLMRRTLRVNLLTQRRAVRWRQQAEKAAMAWPLAGGRRRGSEPQLGRKAEWAGRGWQADFGKETKRKEKETGQAARGFLGQNQIGLPMEKNYF
jgi:hypothetical protein